MILKTKPTLKKVIDKAILDLNKKTKKRENLYVSDVYSCERKVILDFQNIPKVLSPRTYNLFETGNLIHEKLTRYFRKAGLLIAKEVDMPDNPLKLHGRCDMVAKDVNMADIIIEVKSINQEIPNKYLPKKEHVAQLMIYLKYFRCDYGYLLYESKLDSNYEFYRIDFDEKILKEAEDYFKGLITHLENGTMPACKNKNKYPCSWTGDKCCYYSICHPD